MAIPSFNDKAKPISEWDGPCFESKTTDAPVSSVQEELGGFRFGYYQNGEWKHPGWGNDKTYAHHELSSSEVKQINISKTNLVDKLNALERGALKTALLFPKLLFGGIGWVLGATFLSMLGPLGAGIGDSLGTLVGCAISLGLEIVIRKYLLKETDLDTHELFKERFSEALILATGAFVGGSIFGKTLSWAQRISINHYSQAAFTGIVTAGFFVIGTTLARGIYTALVSSKSGRSSVVLSWDNFKKDLCLGLGIIFLAQAAFVGTTHSIVGSWAVGSSPLQGGTALAIGGTVGLPLTEGFDELREVQKKIVGKELESESIESFRNQSENAKEKPSR